MKTIELANCDLVARVDDDDYDNLSRFLWCRRVSKSGVVYAQTSVKNTATGKWKTVGMHRMILGLTDPEIEGDHRDGDGLNNTRENLRATTPGGNRRAKMRKHRTGRTSMFRGVSWNRNDQVWRAKVNATINGVPQEHYLGRFRDEVEAARAYNRKAAELGFAPEALNAVGN